MAAIGRERRRAPRISAEFPIQLRCETGTVDGVLRDVSVIGLCARLPVALREMTLVRMRLDLPGGRDGASVEGVVVRAEKVPNKAPATYDIAVFFSHVTPAARATLEAFIARQTSSSTTAQ
jgi:hypothetical protein